MSTRDGLYEINIACTNYMHRWAHLLSQQMSITIYLLPTKENKLPVSVCSKQTEVAVFHTYGNFNLFAANGKLYILIYIYCKDQ